MCSGPDCTDTVSTCHARDCSRTGGYYPQHHALAKYLRRALRKMFVVVTAKVRSTFDGTAFHGLAMDMLIPAGTLPNVAYLDGELRR